MPLTRPLAPEEDICLSVSTTIRGLVAKYNSGSPPAVDAKALLASIVANTALGVNELIEACGMTFTEKSALRGDMKTICNRAFRAKLGVVSPNGQVLDAAALPEAAEDDHKDGA